jgi:hypothetical protein
LNTFSTGALIVMLLSTFAIIFSSFMLSILI